jgi:hypothetical protein
VAAAYSIASVVETIQRHCKELEWTDVCDHLKEADSQSEEAMNQLRLALAAAERHLEKEKGMTDERR